MKAIRMARVMVDIIDRRTDGILFEDLEIAYRVVIDSEMNLNSVRQKRYILDRLPTHITSVLLLYPKGQRIVDNKGNYAIVVKEIESDNLH